MSSKKEIGAVIKLDGEQDFRRGVANAAKELKNLDSESRLVEEQFKGQKNTLEALRAAHDVLGRSVEAHRKKEDEIRKALENARRSYDNIGKGLEKLLGDWDKETEKLEELKGIYGESSDEVKEQERRVQELSDAIKRGERNYETAGNRIQGWETDLNNARAETVRANRELEENTRHLQEAENAVDHCAGSIDEFGREVRQSGDAAEDAADDVGTFGDVLKANLASEAIKAGIEKIAEGIKTAGSYALDAGMSFEAGMSEVAAISGAAGSELAALTEKAKEMGATTKFSATESAEAFKYMAMAGWDSGRMLDGISGVMELAAASGEELGSVSDIVTDALSAFGMQAAEAAHFSDILAMASSRSNTNVAMMGETFKYAAPVAGALGYSAEDTAIAIGMMANSGIKASQAGTALRRILTATTGGVELTGKAFAGAGQSTGKFVIETRNADGSMRKLNDIIGDMRTGFSRLSESERAANAEAIAGKVGMSGLLAIMNETDANYKKLTDSIYNCEGATAKMAGTMQDNLKGKIVILQSALEGLGISAYEKFSVPMQDGVEDATAVIEHLTAQMNNGELGAAMERLSEAFADSADGAVSFGAVALETVADGLAWIIEHGNEIAAALKGITSGLIMYKAVVTVTGVVEGIKKLKTALDAATTVQELFNLAQLKSPYAMAAAGVVALGVALASYVKGLKKANSEADRQAEKVSDMGAAAEKAAEKVQESRAAFEDTKKSIAAEAEAARILVERLYELAASEENSNAKKIMMKTCIDQINEKLPGLNLALDEQTGAFNRSREAVEEYIGSMGKMNLYEAYGDRLAEVADQMAEANIAIADAELEKRNADEQIKALEEEKNRIREKSVTVTGDEIAQIEELSRQQDVYRQNMEKCDEGMEEQQKILTQCENEQTRLNESMKIAEEQMRSTTEAAEGSTEAYRENSDAASQIAASADAQKEALQSLRDKFEEIKSSIQQSMESKISLFDVFDGGDSPGLDAMKENLDSQIEGLTNWKDNMQTLAGEIGDSMTVELYDHLMELGPGAANAVQEMVDALDGGANEAEMKGIAERYAEALDLTDAASEEMAETQAVIRTALGEMSDSSDLDFTNLIGSLDSAADAAAENGQVISQELEDAFLQAAEAARQIGAEIPEGLAESMASGDVSVEEAVSALKGSMEAQFEFLSGLAGDAGIKIPESIRRGIEQGGDAAVQAIAGLQELLAQKQQEAEELFEKSGKENTEATGKGVESAKAEVAGKTGSVMQEAARTAAGYGNSFTDVGYSLMKGVEVGLNSGSGLVYNKVRQIMNQAKEEAKKETKVNSPSRVWRDEVGSPIAEGLALGIGNGEKDVRAASADLAKASLDETKKELEIHSPSEKFEKQVGRQITAGVAFGIKVGKKKSRKAAKKMAQEVAAAAQEAVENFKKNNADKINQTLDDEEYMWQQLAKKAKKGSRAYRKEIKKLAKENLKEIEQQRKAEKLSTQESLLDNYKEYYELSAKAEMEYWDTARKQYEEGTDARLKADKKYFEARDSYNEQLKALQDDYKDKCDEINEKLLDDIEEQTKAYEEAFAGRKSAIKSAFGTFDEFTSEAAPPEKLLANMQSQVSGYALWMEQLEELEGKGILKNPFIEELRQMGPEAAATILSLNMMTEEQLRLAQEAWEEKDRLAEGQAAKETETLRAQSEERIRELREAAQRELDEQKKLYDAAASELSETLSAPLKELVEQSSKLGADAVAGMIKGLKGKVKEKKTTEALKSVERQMAKGMDGLPAKGKTIGKNTLAGILKGLSDRLEIKKGAKSFVEELEAAVKREAGIRSPSARFRDAVGRQIPAGVAQGIRTGTKEAGDAGAGMVEAMLEQAAEQARRQQAAIAGQMAAINAGAGIAALDRLTARPIPQQTNVTVNNSGVADIVAGLTEEVRAVRGDIQRIKVVLDTGETVGAIAREIGNELTMQTRRW